MLKLLQDACQHVTGENWAKVIEKTKQTILQDCDRFVRLDRLQDELIINVGDDSDTTDSDSDSDSIIFSETGE